MVLQVSANAKLEQEEREETQYPTSRRGGRAVQEEVRVPDPSIAGTNMNAKPNAQNKMPHRHVSAMHSSMMFETSRVRPKRLPTS